MASHNKVTKLRRGVVRETPCLIRDAPLMVRLDPHGITFWVKRSRIRQTVAFEDLWHLAQKKRRAAMANREGNARRRERKRMATYFLLCRQQGHTNTDIEKLCAKEGRRQPNGQAWSWPAIQRVCDLELRRRKRAKQQKQIKSRSWSTKSR